MKNTQLLAALLAIATVSAISAGYIDANGVYHSSIVEHTLDTVTGGRYSDAPADRDARKKADRELEDKNEAAERKYKDKNEAAERKHEDEQRKIQKEKKDRRSY